MTDVEAVWERALQLKDESFALSMFAQRRTYFLKQDCPDPKSLLSPIQAPSKVWRASNSLDSFDPRILKDLREFMLYMFLREAALKEK